MTTPAPTLEELPPEKGTILKLHSIGNEQYDGKLVEYLKAGSNPGKIYVSLLEDTNSSMQVKTKCCRRPDILPVELRDLLASLAKKIHESVDNSESYESADGDITRLKSILSKDPCCIFAHNAIGLITLKKDGNRFDPARGIVPSSKEVILDSIQYYRRGIANWYAYQGLAEDGYLVKQQRFVSTLLFTSGKFTSAGRSHKKYRRNVRTESNREHILGMIQKAGILLGRAFDLDNDRTMQVKLYLESAETFFKILEMAVTNKSNNMYFCDDNLESDSAYAIEGLTTILIELFAIVRDSSGNLDDAMPIAKAVQFVYEGLLSACTAENGTVYFLQAHDVENWKDEKMYFRVYSINSWAHAKMEEHKQARSMRG